MNKELRKIMEKEIDKEISQKLYESEKEIYKSVLPYELSIEHKYKGFDSMYSTFAPMIELVIDELLENNQFSIPRIEFLKKIGITDFFNENKVNTYQLKAYSNLIEKILEKMGYKQSDKFPLIYVFYNKT